MLDEAERRIVKWYVLDNWSMVVVLPDEDGHDEEAELCECCPRMDYSGRKPLLIHNRMETRRPDHIRSAMLVDGTIFAELEEGVFLEEL